MDNLLPEFEPYKDRIPEFIIKLYHILEQKQFQDYLCWHGDGEILIKSGKKLQEKVLPHFFRHRHLSSFVRQLNMYKFNKVNKLTKQKNYMYFKNEHFKRGQVKEMCKIKRNNRKNRKDGESAEEIEEDKEEQISINQELEDNVALEEYRRYVKGHVKEVLAVLKKIEAARPEMKAELAEPLAKCHQLLELPSENSNFSYLSIDESNVNKNMMSTMKLLPIFEPVLFPSQCSLFHIN